jgi:para-aminobenzoate synthetase/4-amino-4-deoxychorismate lyase
MADRWQPNRNRGVFETLLVVDGKPVELEAHLDRLARSLKAVYAQVLSPQAEEELLRAAPDLELGRLRITVAPAEDGPPHDRRAGGGVWGAVFPVSGVKLRSFPVTGGLGEHKWTHRPGLNRPGPGEAGALIVDEGEVLEAGWANVFAVRAGTLFTPPLDGRPLPGTTRAAVLELAEEEGIEAREQPLLCSDLLAASETFLTGSIRGIEAAEELDGQPLPGCGPLSRRLAAALRRRWGLNDGSDDPAALATAPRVDQLSR